MTDTVGWLQKKTGAILLIIEDAVGWLSKKKTDTVWLTRENTDTVG